MAGDGSDLGVTPLVTLANGYYRAIEGAQGSLPESTQLVLRRTVNGWRLSWPLALILAGGRIADQGGTLPAAFAASGGDQLVAQVGKFKSAFPPSFLKFLSAVEAGQEAAGASYFQSTLSDLAGYLRELLNGFLASDPFLSVAQKLVDRLGGPQQQQRAAARSPAPYQVVAGPQSALDQSAFLAARLRAAGWQPADIDRILAGPDNAHQTAERLYRQVAANSPQAQAAFVNWTKTAAPGDLPPTSVDPELLQRSTKLLDGTASLQQGFDSLSPKEQARLLALLQQQPIANPDVQFTKPGKTPAAINKAQPDSGVTGALKSGLDLATTLAKGLLGSGTSDSKGSGKKTSTGANPSKPKDDLQKELDEEIDADADGGDSDPLADDATTRASQADPVPDFIDDSADVVD